MLRLIPALLGLTLLTSCASPGLDAPRVAEIDRIVQQHLPKTRAPGLVIGVIEGKKSSVFGYGRVSKNSEAKPRGDTVYEIGSITKVFTAFLLADLAQEGIVKLNDPIKLYLPEGVTPPRGADQEIQLSHLASHRSGLPRVPANLPVTSDDPYANYRPDMLYDFLKAHRLRWPVDKKYEYSNLGMGLLGNLLERATGKPYEELVVRRLATSLRMSDTRITLTDGMKARLAPPYDGAGNPGHNWHFQALAGAGAIRSTVDDLLKFAAANLGQGDPHLTGVLASCHAVRPNGEISDRLRVGLAWHHTPLRAGGPWIIWHNGATGGYTAFLGFSKETGTAVVVLSNGASQNLNESSVADRIGLDLLNLLNP